MICVKCFLVMNPHLETAGLVKDAETVMCCFCLARTTAGIRVLIAPEIVPCKGCHDEA